MSLNSAVGIRFAVMITALSKLETWNEKNAMSGNSSVNAKENIAGSGNISIEKSGGKFI
jgi:hypothetical protein